MINAVSQREAGEIQSLAGAKHRQTFRENYLNALIGKSWLGRTIPDKPKSSRQMYRLTKKGQALSEKLRIEKHTRHA